MTNIITATVKLNESQFLQSENEEYWVEKWKKGETKWQKNYIDPVLEIYVSYLRPSLSCDSIAGRSPNVFVPLCGKSLDMMFLSSEGFNVVGCDISELAAFQFYSENSMQFQKFSTKENATVYSNEDKNIKFIIGSIYDQSIIDTIGVDRFDGIWDCNALIAVNPDDREKYINILCSLLKPKGRILLSTFDYDQSVHQSFPHSVSESIVKSLFEPQMTVRGLAGLSSSEDKFLLYFMSICQVSNARRPIFSIARS